MRFHPALLSYSTRVIMASYLASVYALSLLTRLSNPHSVLRLVISCIIIIKMITFLRNPDRKSRRLGALFTRPRPARPKPVGTSLDSD